MAAAIQVSLFGCGGWGKNIARNLFELGVLHSIVDPSPAARELADKMGVKHHPEPSKVLSDASVTAVAVATPAPTHFGVAQAALLAGKDVFVEKPISLTVTEGEAIRSLAEERQRIVMVGHLLNYHPVFLALKTIAREGKLGRIRHIYSNRLSLGMVRSEENVLWSFAPHDVSMILALAGTVPARVATAATTALQNGIADFATVNMVFASGLTAAVNVSWLHPEKEQKLVIVGDEAMAVFRDTAPWEEKLTIYRHKTSWINNLPKAVPGEAEKICVPFGEPLRSEMQHFIECVEARKTPRTDAIEAIDTLKILQAAQASMDNSGAWVDLVTVDPRDAKAVRKAQNIYVDNTAKIDAGVNLGEGCRIWHFSHVLTGSKLGKNCILGQNVMVGPDVTVGNGCKIQNNVAVYKGVTLEDDVFCGPSMVFTNVLTPRAHVERKNEFAETRIGKGATLGANCTVVCGHNVGAYAMVGAGAVVTKDVSAHALVVGNPARQIGWVSRSGERLNNELVCPRTGEEYEIVQGKLQARSKSS